MLKKFREIENGGAPYVRVSMTGFGPIKTSSNEFTVLN